MKNNRKVAERVRPLLSFENLMFCDENNVENTWYDNARMNK